MTGELLYFDNNATTALAPEALDAMLPWLREDYGNPSSSHAFGGRAADGIAAARASVARLVGAGSPREVTFTSGGTESLNTLLFGALAAGRGRAAARVLTSAVEHAAIETTLEKLETRRGTFGFDERFEVERIPVDDQGRLDVDGLLATLDERTAVVALLWANNETGVLLPRAEIERIGSACRELGVPFVLDAVQAAGKVPLDVRGLPVDALALSAHKLHGPKGVGALWTRPGQELEPLLFGGPQEHDRRAGTENVPGIVGFGTAADLALTHLVDGTTLEGQAVLRDHLEAGLTQLAGVRIAGGEAPRVANTTSALFEGLSGEALLLLASEEGLAVSTGSACDSAHAAPSHVLRAMGYSDLEAGSALRFSLSRWTRTEDVEAALEIVARAAGQLRELAP